MTESTSTPKHSDLRDITSPVWRRKWLVLTIVVLSTTATYVASSRQEKHYRSETRVLVSASAIQTIVNGPSGGTDRDTHDQAELMLSRPVLQGVIKRLDLPESPAGLLGTVTATATQGSNFVVVEAERASGDQAAKVANAVVAEYIAYRGERLVRDVDPVINSARRQLANLPKGDSGALQRESLRSRISQLQAARDLAPSQARQTDLATASSQPFSPRPKRDAFFGLIISLVLALALAFNLERFDRRLTRPDELPDIYGVPLLSVIPHTERTAAVSDGVPAVPEALREPFRALRTNLQMASIDTPIRCLTITSAVPGEGKSTIVRNLALTYHEWGLKVVVLECDLRRPSLSRFFGVEQSGAGLTSVLTGESTLEEALVDVEVDSTSVEYLAKVRASGPLAVARERGSAGVNSRLTLLPSGDAPPNPQAVLATDATRRIIEQLSLRFDVVLIDTPPLLAVSDAVPVIAHSDGVVLVARMGLSDRNAAKRVVDAIGRVPQANILGVVANDLASEIGSGYGYGYTYGYGTNGATTKG